MPARRRLTSSHTASHAQDGIAGARHKDAGLPDHIRQTALHGYHIVVGAEVQRPTIALNTCGSLSPSMTCTRQTPRSHPVNVSVGDAAMRLAVMRPEAS